SCLAFYVIGYNLMYVDVGGVIGSFQLFYSSSAAEIDLVGGNAAAVDSVVSNGYSVLSDWFFQMVFVATTSSIVSGAIAERAKLFPFFGFTLVLAAFIYPVVGAWTWGGGWLAEQGFSDFAGSTIVHSVGGWAALAGVIVIGPRLGKFRKDGTVKPTPPSNVVAVTLGIFILWLGWFGFNGGSQLALGSALDAVAMSTVLVNTNLAACAGVLAALVISRPLLGRIDLFAGLNGAIAGLVSITAGPTMDDHYWAILIGAIGGIICTLGIKGLEKIKVDDVVGAIPAHLMCGIWGTLAAALQPDVNLGTQLIGVLAVGAFVFVISFLVWTILDRTTGLRVSPQAEHLGQDVAELGMESYPEFVLMPDTFDDE
ncbi:MAG: ammonium transporter, partial [bacterium]|nr:ammonium transporter [bacterium]